ncbi:MAG: thymidylate kinase-like protein [Chloroflexota bacterium]|nr:thymidylate kinase-like protein [Chloroflexota bacterium]
MVTVRPGRVENREVPSFIYITGCDGTGKTTQARLLIDHLQALGVQPKHLWLRFPFLLSIPLLAYARWRGYSWYEEADGTRHGYWEFQNSSLLRALLPWTLLVDAALAALIKIYVPLALGRTIVCERFALDMVVDLSVAFKEVGFYRRLPGKLYRQLLPKDTRVMILDLDVDTIRARRQDLRVDRRLEDRLQSFRTISSAYALPVLPSTRPAAEVHRSLCEQISTTSEG